MPDQPVYTHDGRTLFRRDADGNYIPIGEMSDAIVAEYVAMVLNTGLEDQDESMEVADGSAG